MERAAKGKAENPSVYRRAIANGIVEILSVYRSAVLHIEQRLLSDSMPILATVTQGLNKVACRMHCIICFSIIFYLWALTLLAVGWPWSVSISLMVLKIYISVFFMSGFFSPVFCPFATSIWACSRDWAWWYLRRTTT